jgi:hypothetical protein
MGRKVKLKPYFKDGQEKYTAGDFDTGHKKNKKMRQEARDANRKLKKSKRQELKREVRDLVEKVEE